MKRRIFTPLAIGLSGILTLFALIALMPAPSLTNAQTSASSATPDELLRNALQQARDAGSYRVQIDVTQRVLPLPNSDPILAPMQPHTSETLVYAIEGLVRDAQHMRFSLRDRRASNGLQGSLNQSPSTDLLVADGVAYERHGDGWERQNAGQDNAQAAPGLNSDALLLLEVAKQVRQLQPAEGLGGQFERVAFSLHSDDVLRFLLAQRGQLTPQNLQLLRASGASYSGDGELWIDAHGYPARLALEMRFERSGGDAYRALVASTAEYGQFGQPLAPELFDPAVAPLSLQSRSVLPGVSITSDQLIQVSLQWGALLAALILLVVLIAYTRRRWRGPRLTRALNLVLIVTMITPGVARAGYPEQPSQQTPEQQSEVTRMMREARSVAQKNRIGPYAPQADALPDQADQDNDGLPNGYEIQLGTNPFARDTDLDGLDDKTEVVGKPCPTYDGDPSPANVVTDPLNPDSNYDSIRDGDELQTGKCWAGKQPYAWSDDNDGDGVPDVVDLSPFSASGDLGAKFVQEWPSAGYYQPMPGANLSFDPVGNTTNTGAQPVEPFYVEVQVVPQDRDTLRYAYKDALYWPKGDDLGNIRNLVGMTTTGKLTVVPFLEVTVFEDDMPSAASRNAYGIGASKVISECTANCDFHLVIPLAPVERAGLTHALQGKVLYEARDVQRLSWQDMRLKWALRGNIGRPGPDNTTEPGDFGFAIYDEGYRITGMQVQRQGGAQTLVAAAKPTGPQQKLTDGPVALLRAGLEARFLTGGIGIPDIQQRFDIATANSTPITDRWGITFTYYITSQTNFVHLDQALLTTNITLTRAMLNKAYPSHNISPTLVIATQQRTATINLDEIDAPNYADLSFNLCGKDMVTSRSLRLATYDWDPLADSGLAILDFGLGISDFGLNQDTAGSGDPNQKSAIQNPQSLGDWYLMGLEEVLKKVQSEYDQIFSKSDPFYEAGLTVLKLVTANWNQGITAIQNMGSITWQDIANAITDLGLYQRITQWLFEQGFLPAEFALVVNFVLGVWEAGGPVAWLEQQWNLFVSFIDGFGKLVSGSVVNFTLTPATTGDGTVNLSLADLMSFTRTAINVLNYFANILGLGVLADIAKILTKVLEILEKVRQVWNTIQAGIQAIQKGIDAALTVIANELKAVAKPMGVFGLIVFVGFTLFNLFMTLANASGITQLIFAVLVLKAVWEIVKAVVLFVIASYFPIGTIVAAGVALINWLVDMVGGVAGEVLQWIFDPIGALLDAILANPPPEQLTNVFGNPSISGLDFVRYPDAPLGGIMEGQRFGFALTGTLSMSGPSRGLSHSGAKMYLGRYAGGKDFELCGMSILQFLQDTGNEDEAAEYGIDIVLNRCRTFSFSSEYLWSYSNNTRKYIKSSQYLTDTIYLENGTSFELPFDIRLRDFTTASELTVTPHRPAINGKIALDVSYKIRAWFENCGILGLDCDEYSDAFFTPPAGSYVYFDILPTRLRDLWHWEDLFNDDADGDGIKGYKNDQDNPVGQDATLCGNDNAANPDADGDGLGDNYELQNDTDPCNPDGDGDGIKDGRELELGTDPNLADTDGDGLHDGQEVPYWYDYDDTLTTNMLWTVNMGGAYAGLPDPLAFPNPRQANFDNDHRSDSREKVKLTSPNAYNPVPVGEPLELAAAQRLLNGGGTEVNMTNFEWPNDEASALSATLTISLPVPFTGLSASINMITKTGVPQLDLPQAIAGLPPNTYGWKLPPLWLGRKVSVTLSGLPQIVSTPVSVTVNMVYSEATTAQHSTSQVLLLVNRGGPDVRILSPISGTIWTGAPQTLNGSARDPEGVARVDVCVNTVQAPCAAASWQPATGKRQWLFNWTPPGSGRYYLYARGTDSYNVTGPVFGPVVVTVDAVPPNAASFDYKNTRYLSTTLSSDASPLITLTGRVSDTAGAFASGAGQAFIRIVSADTNKLHNTDVIQPGALSSAYVFSWTFPLGSLGKAAPAANRLYSLTVQGVDVAGNTGGLTETLRVVVDDYPPLVQTNPPQTAASAIFSLTGKASDLTLLLRESDWFPYTRTQTLAAHDTQFSNLADGNSRALIVGDVNGDTIDDVALIEEDSVTKRTKVGLFFGLPDGLPSPISMANANVTFDGETPNTSTYLRALASSTGAAGDLNGDGVGDLVIGDPQIGNGKAYVVLGKRGWVGSGWQASYALASAADWVLTRTATQEFGGALAFGGDVDGDGLTDLLVGSSQDGSVAPVYGNTYLYLGRERGTPSMQSFIAGCMAGCSRHLPELSGAGDTNGDGLSDALVAISGARVALVYGRPKQSWPASSTLDAVAGAWLYGVGNQQTVARAGDVNGDGLSDMLIGDPESTATFVYVVLGRRPEHPFPAPPLTSSLPISADASFVALTAVIGAGADSHIGAGLTAMGDLDRDGKADFAFGQHGNGNRPNRTAIVLGAALPMVRNMPVASATLFISGTSNAQMSGYYLSSGDVSADGVRDLLIGAPGGTPSAYLFEGKITPGTVSGIARVEIGLSGPIGGPSQPPSQTLPATWSPATLRRLPGARVNEWRINLNAGADGDYRVYARAVDLAGNRIGAEGWYVGNVNLNTGAVSIPSLSAALNPVQLSEEKRIRVVVSGTVTSPARVQQVRAYDGERWYRLPPQTGAWSNQSFIPRFDLRRYDFRVVARDAFGNSIHVTRTVTTDTLVLPPDLLANQPTDQWQTNITPTLVVTWPAVVDASTPVQRYASIDVISNTNPVTLVNTNQVTRLLDAPGVYYAHVRVADAAGNQRLAHIGPFPVNRLFTPSAVQPDGAMDLNGNPVVGGEYPLTTFLGYDPYSNDSPAALYGTWDASTLWLAYPANQWGDAGKHLAVYLDTQSGGTAATLGISEPVHTLPFAADYAMLVGAGISDTQLFTLYAGSAGGWTLVSNPASVAWVDDATEIAFRRSEIAATGGLSLLAYAYNNSGIYAVLPAGARPTSTNTISGSVVFAGNNGFSPITWPSLGNGIWPGRISALTGQVLDPIVSVDPEPTAVLTPGQQTSLTISVMNPDIFPYSLVPVTVSLGSPAPQLMQFTGSPQGGVACSACPAGGQQWVISMSVSAGATAIFTLNVQALTPAQTGVYSVPVTIKIGQHGLPGQVGNSATSGYVVDYGVVQPQFAQAGSGLGKTIFVKPGLIKLGFFNDGKYTGQCKQTVQANVGAGFINLGALGQVSEISGTIAGGQTQVWQLRGQGQNGQLSQIVSRTLVADNSAPPQVIFQATLVFTKFLALLQGSASDNNALDYVEVRINSGPFVKAVLGDGSVLNATADAGQSQVSGPMAAGNWTLPIELGAKDGVPITLTARAVDEAGNAGPLSPPQVFNVDNTGPQVTAIRSNDQLSGTASDGSGVASVAVSVNGGTSYQPATRNGNNWSRSVAGASMPFALVRAVDVHGNETVVAVPLSGAGVSVLYLPVVRRR